MKRSFLSAGTAVLATVAAILAICAPANAVTPKYVYNVYAGATQAKALGVAVQSEPTAPSQIFGALDATAKNKIASAKVGTVIVAGVGETDVSAKNNTATGGVTLVSHAKTTGLSLFGGLIKATAIETTATIDADSGEPTTDMKTDVLGLTIQGKPYKGGVDPNTGITIPGLLSITLNQQDTAANEDSAAIIGAGLRVTLLGPRNGTSAGATVAVNPVAQLLQPGFDTSQPGFPLQGTAYGAYVYANVGDQIEAETGKFAKVDMPTVGTDGRDESNATAKAFLQGVLNLGAIYTEQNGIRTDALSQSKEEASIANVNLFNGLIAAKALNVHSSAAVTEEGDETEGTVEGGMTFVSLTIAGQKIPVDVGPNTKINVANLGTVTINKQIKAVQETGSVRFHGQRTVGLEIVLDTKRAGLPVGAIVEVAFTQALVWQ